MTTESRLSGDTLIIGGNGLLGGALRRYWSTQGRDVVATDRNSLDLAGDLTQWSPPVPPAGGVAILCASVTGQKDSQVSTLVRFINVDQTITLGRRLMESGYFLIFLSTSLVFDGVDPVPPTTTRPTTPITAYGRDKADAERGLSAIGGDLAIVRLTKVVHENLAILANWRAAISEGKAIYPFSDYKCAPISLSYAVSVVAAVAESRAAGIWHLSSRDEISYGDLARAFAQREGFPDSLVRPVQARAGSIEHLPAHAALDASRTESAFGFRTPLARAALEG